MGFYSAIKALNSYNHAGINHRYYSVMESATAGEGNGVKRKLPGKMAYAAQSAAPNRAGRPP
ncbi:MAG: hypothetical protein JWP58_1779 [Hymenobacter sp.]|nr:hypothetical protein [Hymenobacter sp.]